MLLPVQTMDRFEELPEALDPLSEVFLHRFPLIVGQLQFVLHVAAEHDEGTVKIARNFLACLVGDVLGGSPGGHEAEQHQETQAHFQSLHDSLSFVRSNRSGVMDVAGLTTSVDAPCHLYATTYSHVPFSQKSIEILDPNILDVKFRDRLDFDAEQPRLVVGRVGIVVD